jgi:DNA-binding transcriptional MerR regulator
MNIHELEQLTGQPARNIRFLIAEGIVPEPHGKARWASYGDEHVRALEFYAELKASGVTSLSAIRERVARRTNGEEHVVLSPLPGVEIRIEPSLIADVDLDDLIEEIRTAIESVVPKTREED